MNLADFNIPLIFWISFMMVVWFESDIVQTIANLTNTRNLLKINEFHKYKMEVDMMSNYPDFLHSIYPGYFTKLVSCPICLCFWSNFHYSIPAIWSHCKIGTAKQYLGAW